MNLEAKIAFVHAQTICALAKIEGMKAANLEFVRAELEGPLPYGELDFQDVSGEFQIAWNSVLEYLRD